MLLASTEHDACDTKFVILRKLPEELMIEHQGANVSIKEHERSSGVCDDR